MEDYVTKARKKGSNNCKFILLTLSNEFPDKDDKFVEENWRVINYSNLKGHITSQYLNNEQISERDKTYIQDYCDFIEQLDQLKAILIPNGQQSLFVQGDKGILEEIRLHDLYIKLRYSWFAVCLKNHLEAEGIKTKVVNKYEELEFGVLNINVAINQGNGQIAAWICDRDKEKDGKTNTFEIVIQGNQYRHGITQVCIDSEKQVRPDRLNELYTRLYYLKDLRPSKFLDFQDEYSLGSNITQPDKIKNHRKNKPTDPVVPKSGRFNCYDDSYIYIYKEIDDISIGQILKWMVKDIKNIYSNIPKLN